MVPVVRPLRATPYGGTLWFRYSSELTAKTTTPPGEGQAGGRGSAPSTTHPPTPPLATALTYGLGHSKGLGAVEGEAGEGPDDRVDLLRDVQGNGHDGACVLPHSHPPGDRQVGRPGLRGLVPPTGAPAQALAAAAHSSGASPWPGLVGLEEDKQGGLVVAVQELQVHDVEQLLVQAPHVDDVAGQEAGPLPGGNGIQRAEGAGDTDSGSPALPQYSPLPHKPLVLLGQALPAEGQDHQACAVDEHGCAAPVGVHPHPRRVHVLHKPILGTEGVIRRAWGQEAQGEQGGLGAWPGPTRSSGSSK